MRYLEFLKENKNSFENNIKELKSQSYSQFINNLIMKTKEGNFRDKLLTLPKPDVDLGDYGYSSDKTIKAKFLYPTQSQIGLQESLSWMSNIESINEIIIDKKAKLFSKNRLFVANNKWILDGHHRWAYVYMLNPEADVPYININLPGKGPVEIIKDIQLSIIAKYGDLFLRPTPIKYDLSRMEDSKILEVIPTQIAKDKLEIMRTAYNSGDLSKLILREFIIPEGLLEASHNDFVDQEVKNIKTVESNPPVDPKFQELESTDNDNPDLDQLGSDANAQDYALDIAGWADPTPLIDGLRGVFFLYEGEYFIASCYFLSAGVPYVGDLVGKTLIALARNFVVKKLLRRFGTFLKSFDVEEAAKVWLNLEKLSPQFAEFAEMMIKYGQKIVDVLGKLVRAIGHNWLKLRLFLWLFQNRIINFFVNLVNIKKNLREYLNKTSSSDVYGILATNAVKIKRTIIDKKIDRSNNNFALGIHPVQTALKVKANPYSGDFKGIPVDLLKSLPKTLITLQPISSEVPKEDTEKKNVDDFTNFTQKPAQQKTDVVPSKTELSPDPNPITPTTPPPTETPKVEQKPVVKTEPKKVENQPVGKK